jgi:conjugative transfer region protein TrbK
MKKTTLDRLPMMAAMVLVVLIVAACATRLRDDENQNTSATSFDQASDPQIAKLAECRSVTYEQKDALTECRKAWAEKRRQFLGQDARPLSDSRMPQTGSSLFVAPKDESRVPSGFPSIQQNEKE